MSAQATGGWQLYDEMERRLTRHVSERMLDLVPVVEGMRVLDVASGRGEPAIPAAHRVGPRGFVLGVDVSEPMLAMARARAERESLKNIELRMADAAHLAERPESFDAATVRWGLMAMAEPVRALASIHQALRPGGQLVIASWTAPERVSFSLPRRVLDRVCRVAPGAPTAPGMFRHADPSVLAAELGRAGFSLRHSEELSTAVGDFAGLEDVVAWYRAIGGAQRVDSLLAPERQAWKEALSGELEPFTQAGRILLGGVTRLDVAQKPAH